MTKRDELRVFFSYDSSDGTVARKLAANIGSTGHDVFPGDDWPSSINAALERANAMVVLVSERSMKSPWVLQELSYAIASPQYSGRVVPVFVEGSTEVPWVLRQFKSVRLGQDLDRTAKQIVRTLESAA